jgi:hypothetical protein
MKGSAPRSMNRFMSTTSTSTNDNILLDPVSVSNKVFQDDQRPVILFDGGMWICFSQNNV